MRRLRDFLVLAIMAGGMVAIPRTQTPAAVPSLVNYQGILTDGGGLPQVGTFSITFSIYGVPAGGTAFWTEAQPSVMTDNDGHFAVLLGSFTTLNETVFAGPDRWMGITVSPDTDEMLPRQQIVSAAYAFRPATVDGASGGNITSKVSIGPGHSNTGDDAFVAGANNAANGHWSNVGGGISNEANGESATVSGGFDNTASGYRSAIGGGWGNVASGAYTNVCGGGFNTASDGSATVGGGYANYATGIYSTTAGGLGNAASGAYSFVAGGNSNAAGGAYSFAAGRRARVNHNGTFAWADSSVDADFNSSAANQFLIRAAGGVGIGTNSPAEQLHVVGNIFATGCVIGSNIACPSDARFKKNIQTMDHALDALGHLRGVRYEWRHDEFPDREFTEGQQIGLIAQEVQNVIPQAVVKQSDGYLAVDYARLVPLLIEAVKEQQKRIEALEKKLERQTP